MKLYSWNINGIRAVLKKGDFQKFLAQHDPDILCLQETKIDSVQLSKWRETTLVDQPGSLSRQGVAKATSRSEKSRMNASAVSQPESMNRVNLQAMQDQAEIDVPQYEEYWNSAERKGHFGTAIFTKTKPLQILNNFPDKIAGKYNLKDGFGDPNLEGRITAAEFEKFWVVTVYTPNSKGDLGRLPLRYKAWDPAFLEYLKFLEKTKPVLVSGDFNVAHKEIDLARPKENVGKHGFTAEERERFQQFIDAGFIDTYRMFYPDKTEAYTWWTHWANARARNVGWRIDYWLASPELKSHIKSAEIHPNIMGSDHCPTSIEVNL